LWDKVVLTDLCLTRVLTDLCLTLYIIHSFSILSDDRSKASS